MYLIFGITHLGLYYFAVFDEGTSKSRAATEILFVIMPTFMLDSYFRHVLPTSKTIGMNFQPYRNMYLASSIACTIIHLPLAFLAVYRPIQPNWVLITIGALYPAILMLLYLLMIKKLDERK